MLLPLSLLSQVTDSAIVDTATDVGQFEYVGEAKAEVVDTFQYHSPRTAALYSAVLPGLGQAYNKKYWKIPILYAGMGTLIYYAYRNNFFYNQFRDAWYELEKTGNLSEGKYELPGFLNIGDKSTKSTQLKKATETYQRWRDGTIIGLVAVYFLNIIDATVDAHFYNFDVTNELSLKIKPTFINTYYTGNIGLTCSLHFY